LSDYDESYGHHSNPVDPDSDNDGLDDSDDPNPESAFHRGYSENYSMSYTLNEGGDFRTSASYRLRDSLGSAFSQNVLPLESHPTLTITPTIVDFHTVTIGNAKVISLNMSNSGIGNLLIGTLSFTGNSNGEFSARNDTCSGQTLASAGTCSVEVVFIPTSTGLKDAAISVSSNDSAVPTRNVDIYGVGTNTEICEFSIIPDNQVYGSSGGSGNVLVSSFSEACSWTAISHASWVTITAGESGNGNGTVSYSVGQNSGVNLRTGTMTIAGKTFTVTQSGVQTCIDIDSDGYGSPGNALCSNGPQTDCNDNDGSVHPGASEICDGKDNDCNAGTPDGSSETWYGQQTDCGIGVCESTGILTCSDGVQTDTCMPGNPTETPEQSCDDNLDNDCDGSKDCYDEDCLSACPSPPRGDCNADQKTDAGDISAIVLEIFDGDGNLPETAPGGTFLGSPVGCNANGDGVIDAGDISCTVLRIFGGPGACGN